MVEMRDQVECFKSTSIPFQSSSVAGTVVLPMLLDHQAAFLSSLNVLLSEMGLPTPPQNSALRINRTK